MGGGGRRSGCPAAMTMGGFTQDDRRRRHADAHLRALLRRVRILHGSPRSGGRKSRGTAVKNAILHCTILYYAILYYAVPYYTILYYTILYYTILYTTRV